MQARTSHVPAAGSPAVPHQHGVCKIFLRTESCIQIAPSPADEVSPSRSNLTHCQVKGLLSQLLSKVVNAQLLRTSVNSAEGDATSAQSAHMDVVNLLHAQQLGRQRSSSVKSQVDMAKATGINARLWASVKPGDQTCTWHSPARHLAAPLTCLWLCARSTERSCRAGAWLAAPGCSKTSHRTSAG